MKPFAAASPLLPPPNITRDWEFFRK